MTTDTPLPPAPDTDTERDCYHCGLPVPSGLSLCVTVANESRRMCCVGCQAVAQSIVDSGLVDYYRHRDAMPESRREALPSELQDLGLFDHPDFQKSFVRPSGEHEREASLILEGITCAACVWLNERHIARQPGVSAVEINYATRRARVRWDERQIKLSDILGAINAIGYRAYPYDAERSEQIAQKERRSMLWRVFVAGFGMMQVMMYAIPSYLAGEGGMEGGLEQLMRWASLLLTLPVVFYSAAPFFSRAWRDIKLKHLGMDVPVALGIGSAFAASVWATLTKGPVVYFDSVSMFVFFLLGGRYLEMLARQRAVRGVEEMGKVLPSFAERLAAWPDTQAERVPVSQLQPGDLIRVRPGEVVPADGIVVEGRGEANEALLTGESRPIPKTQGDALTGGSINISSPLIFRVEQVGDSTRLAAIRRMMERASSEKPRVAALSDRVASIFILGVLTLAALAGLVWYFLDAPRALWIFVSVLVVACPCALSLATPTALTVATDVLARLGVLITRGHAIETLARANHYVFDKTGTLTDGRMALKKTLVLDDTWDDDRLIAFAGALEQGSEHPIAQALKLAAQGMTLPPATQSQASTGGGIAGEIDGVVYWLGRPDFVAQQAGLTVPASLADSDETLAALGCVTGWLGAFRFADSIRPEAKTLIGKLQGEHLRTTVLSGDAPAIVRKVAQELHIPDAHGAMSPEDKRAFIETLQTDPQAVVAMVGDGVNDAPVLAQTHVSVAMGGGTDLARNQGDIVLLNENLEKLGEGIDLSRRTLRIIRQNLCWALAYNTLALPLAMAGWVEPWMAGIGMAGSSLLVVLNAMRLQRTAKT